MNRIFTHIKTGNFYRVLGTARSAKNPNKTQIVYEQLYESKLKNTEENLPVGTLWMRTPSDFRKKFALSELDESTINAYLLSQQKKDKLQKAVSTKDNVLFVAEMVGEVAQGVGNAATTLGTEIAKKAKDLSKIIKDMDR